MGSEFDKSWIESRVSRRRFVAGMGAAFGAASLGLIGCNQGTTTPTAEKSTTSKPKRGGRIVAGVQDDLVPSDMGFAYLRANSPFLDMFFGNLIAYAPDKLEPVPQLLESWEISADYTKVKLNVRKGVEYHTGRSFTADDVKWAMEETAKPEVNAPQVKSFSQAISKISMPDKYTLELEFKNAVPNVMDYFAYLYVPDKENLEGLRSGKKMIGLGPFKVKEWVPRQSFTAERNPNYFEEGKPYLDGIEVRIFRDAETTALSLENGQIDVAPAYYPNDPFIYKGSKQFTVMTSPSDGGWYIGFNTKSEQWPAARDKKVRQAVSYAMNRQRFIDEVMPFNELQPLPWTNYSPAYIKDQAAQVKYDLNKAKELLKEAGYTKEIDLQMITMPSRPHSVKTAEILHADLKQIGINIKLEPTEYAQYTTYHRANAYPCMWIAYTVAFIGVQPASGTYLSPQLQPLKNTSNFDSPSYAKAVEDLRKAASEADRQKAYRQINQEWLDGAFILPYAGTNALYVMQPHVKGFKWSAGTAKTWWQDVYSEKA